MIVIGSSAHPELNQLVEKGLDIKLSPCKIGKFPNGESQVRIDVSVRGQNVYVISTGYHPINDNLIETLMICKACKLSNAKSITLIMANYPYSRQDKKTKSRECINASFVAELIEIAGVNRMVTFDLHSAQIQGMFRIPVDNCNTSLALCRYLKDTYNQISSETHIVIAPDAGATKKCRDLAGRLHLNMALIEKNRNIQDNQVDQMILIDQNHSVAGKIAIIYDDIADTMGTLCKACELLEDNGVKEVIAVVAHGIFSDPAIKRLNACKILTTIICTNTLPTPVCDKIKVCDISGIICLGIDCLENNKSLSALFE